MNAKAKVSLKFVSMVCEMDQYIKRVNRLAPIIVAKSPITATGDP